MALNQAKIITVTSVKGGTGKTTTVLNIAGILAKKGKKVVIVDFDLHAGNVAMALNVEMQNDIYTLVNDISNNRFKQIENYIKSYNDNIDVLAAPKDPRNGYKINPKYIDIIIDRLRFKYDVILVDTNHIIDSVNLITFDHSDKIIYVLSADILDIKNMKTMLSIFQDMSSDKYVVLLNEATNRDLLTEYDVKTILGVNVNYILPKSFYVKNMQKIIEKGEIITLNKSYQKAKGTLVLNRLVDDIVK